MKIVPRIVAAATLTLLAGTAHAQLFGISKGSGTAANVQVFQINPANGDLSNLVPVTLAGFTINNALALTANPNNGTLYAVVQVGAGPLTRHLVTVNPATGVATDVGPLTQAISSLSFIGNTLYGTSGATGPNPETLFTVNTTNAALTIAFALGNGADGEIIAAHPSGLLYHSSGNGGVFESVNPVSHAVTSISTSTPNECFGMGWHNGLGVMFGSDIGGNLFSVNLATGARTTIGTMTDQTPGNTAVRGLAYVPQVYGISNGFGTPANNQVFTINPFNGDLTNIVQVTMPGFTIGKSLAITAQPFNGTLYAVVQTGTGPTTRRLVTVNPTTGVCTDVGPLTEAISSLSFMGSTLFATSGATGPNPETLFTVNTTNATLTIAFALGNGADGEIIAAHPSGLLYHSSGNGAANFESIDPVSHLVSPLGTSNSECFAMGWLPGPDVMLLGDITSHLNTVDIATGARTLVGDMSDQMIGGADVRGLAYAAIPPCGQADMGKQGGIAGADGHLDNNDFVVFIDRFFNHSPFADVGIQGGLPGTDQTWDNNDFIVYINLFFAGPSSCF